MKLPAKREYPMVYEIELKGKETMEYIDKKVRSSKYKKINYIKFN